MLFWSTTLALAGTPLLYDSGSAAVHVAAVAERTGLPADQLDPVALTALRERPPMALGEAVVRRCTGGASTNAEVRAELVRAEVALAEGDDVAVVDHLDLAVARLGCLSEVVDGPAVARVFLLRGGVAAEAGRADEARGEFVSALALDPRVVWPPGYPTAGAPLLGEVAQTEPVLPLAVAPRPTSGPWIDGREPAEGLVVRPGLHLAQHSARAGLATAWLVVGDATTWVLPEALLPSALDRFVTGERDAVAQALLATHPEAPAAYVVHGGGIWLAVREGGAVRLEELVAPAVAAPVPSPAPKGRGGKRGGPR